MTRKESCDRLAIGRKTPEHGPPVQCFAIVAVVFVTRRAVLPRPQLPAMMAFAIIALFLARVDASPRREKPSSSRRADRTRT